LESERKRHRRRWGAIGPLVLIVIGVVLLLEQNGIIAPHALSRWWPLLLVFVGAWLLLERANR
jgi:LiaI-LiaF-like transmembrane region